MHLRVIIMTLEKFYLLYLFRSFTCNMHAFGLSRELCTEFLRKQCTIANLNKGIYNHFYY